MFNFTASYRRDGFSHFGENYKYGDFGQVVVNLNLHNLGNLSKTFDNLQFRASYGEVGNTGGQGLLYLRYPYLEINNYLDVEELISDLLETEICNGRSLKNITLVSI